MRQSVKITRDMILAMCKVALEEAAFEPIVKHKVLIVDDEIYGQVEFPRTMKLGRGLTVSFPGYGEVQVVEATVDTLRCTRTIDEGLKHEWNTGPQPADPTPPITPPRVAFAPDGLLPKGSAGTIADVNRAIDGPDVRRSCALPGGAAAPADVSRTAVPCPCPADKPDKAAAGTDVG